MVEPIKACVDSGSVATAIDRGRWPARGAGHQKTGRASPLRAQAARRQRRKRMNFDLPPEIAEIQSVTSNLVRSLLRYEPKFHRSEEHTSELQSLMRISYAVFCLKKKTNINPKM